MKRASRVISQAVASSSQSPPAKSIHLFRPPVLTPARPLSSPCTPPAGPSSLKLFSRRYTTAPPPGADPVVTSDDSLSYSAVMADTERSLSLSGKRPPEIPDDADIPPNVRFEGWEEVREPIPRGMKLHTTPPSALEPIIHPLSSLASDSPTSAMPDSPTVSLPAHIFGLPLRRDILHRCVVWYLALLRQGNQSTKDRGTVAYSGKKLRPQKGTGRARVGDASSGTRRGGAPIFPLHPRDHTQLLPRKVRALGLATALSSKLSSGFMRFVADLSEAGWTGTAEARRALCDGPSTSSPSTGDFTEADASRIESTESGKMIRFGTPRDLSILFIHAPPQSVEDVDRITSFERTVRNLPDVDVMGLDEVEVYHVLKYRWCVLEEGVVRGMSQVVDQAETDLAEEEEVVGPEILLQSSADLPPPPPISGSQSTHAI